MMPALILLDPLVFSFVQAPDECSDFRFPQFDFEVHLIFSIDVISAPFEPVFLSQSSNHWNLLSWERARFAQWMLRRV